ncbi:MAG TPA: pyridoxamine 5'-phosphate oxidase family protein [Thermomicrobiales bacterium]|nr:pyridoxamine 5'-phosphate oxidase family protein [Thermomicrobiales bacterium]
MAEPRGAAQRKADVLAKLREDVDLWVASATAGGDAYLIPLSFYWDGAALVMATPAGSRTTRNLRRTGRARVALGPTRDVVIVEGPVEFVAGDAVGALGDAHAAATGFDARREPQEYVYIRLTPARIQAWREANELAGREVMRDGRWLA